jgi:hypothetical protein
VIYGNIFATPYNSPFGGATAITAGVLGLVPAPVAGQQDFFLRGDGTWSRGSISAWEVITIDTNLTVNHGYITDGASQITYTLPTTADEGDLFKIVGKSTSGWRIDQNVGQTIYMGDVSTTTGTSGYINSTNGKDCIELVCVTADSDFVVSSSIGLIELT